jgi:phenylacetic acid degradation operon negative regulatory protein
MRPDNLPLPAQAVLGTDADCLLALPESDPIDLAQSLFGLRAWHERGRQLLEALRAATASLDPARPATLAEAFVAGAAALQHLRRDPLLPTALVGVEWPGDALRDGYVHFRDEFGSALRNWFSSGEIL